MGYGIIHSDQTKYLTNSTIYSCNFEFLKTQVCNYFLYKDGPLLVEYNHPVRHNNFSKWNYR